MSDIKVTIVGAAIAVSVAGQPIAITTVGQQGPSGPAVPALSNTNVLFSDSNQVGASPNFTFDKTTNVVTVTGNLQATGYLHHSTGSAALAAAGLQAGSGHAIGFSSIANATGTMDTMLRRGGAGILEQRNGANPQKFRVYRNYTDAGNNSYLSAEWNTSEFHLRTFASGSDVATATAIGFYPAASLNLGSGGFATRWQLNTTGHLLAFADNVYDIGASGATRPRTGYFGTSIVTPELFVTNTRTTGTSFAVFTGGKDAGNGYAIEVKRPLLAQQTLIGFSTTSPSVSDGFIGLLPGLSKTLSFVTGNGGTNGEAAVSLSSTNGLMIGAVENHTTTPPAKISPLGAATFVTVTTPVIMGVGNVLEQRNGANAQSYQIYNTYTDASNYERAELRWNGNALELVTRWAGTGVARELRLGVGSGQWKIDSSGSLLTTSDGAFSIGGFSNNRPFNVNASNALNAPTVNANALTFPATQVPSSDANTLDDYEEQPFTPVVTFGGLSTGITYTTQEGTYTKVGRAVHFRLFVQLSSKGSAVGAATVGGLPFSSSGASAHAVYVNNVTVASGSSAQGLLGSVQTAVQLSAVSAGVATNLTNTNFANNSQVVISGTYFV